MLWKTFHPMRTDQGELVRQNGLAFLTFRDYIDQKINTEFTFFSKKFYSRKSKSFSAKTFSHSLIFHDKLKMICFGSFSFNQDFAEVSSNITRKKCDNSENIIFKFDRYKNNTKSLPNIILRIYRDLKEFLSYWKLLTTQKFRSFISTIPQRNISQRISKSFLKKSVNIIDFFL